jgi:hypothetical protein
MGLCIVGVDPDPNVSAELIMAGRRWLRRPDRAFTAAAGEGGDHV